MDSIVTRNARAFSGRALNIAVSTALATAAFALPAAADDLDVYRARIEAQQKPNILFVLDYSGSMARDVDGRLPPARGNESRLSILKQAVMEVLAANEQDINAGIGSTYSRLPSGVRWPVSDLLGDANELDPAIAPGITNSDVIASQLDRMPAAGSTATVNALAEAALYFRGGRVANGDVNPLWSQANEPDVWDPVSLRYNGGNALAAIPSSYLPRDAFKRNQPIGEQYGFCYDFTRFGGRVNNCAPFEPELINECTTVRGSNIREPGTGRTYWRVRQCEYQSTDLWEGANYESPISGQCAVNAIVLVSDGVPTRITETDALTEVLGGPVSGCEDLSNSVFANTRGTSNQGNCGPEIAEVLATTPQIPGNPGSTVKTYTIGFATSDDATNYLDRIATAGQGFYRSADDVDQLTAAFSELVASIKGDAETFTELAIDVDRARFSSTDRAYFNLFQPSGSAAWSGNTKGYFMTADGLKDLQGNDVANEEGSAFADDIQSFWSREPDGNEVSKGGASEQLSEPAAPRNLYTAIGYNGGSLSLANEEIHSLSSTNNRITNALLGLPRGSADRTLALDWLQTAPMGDALHTKPVTVDYGTREVLYTMTNQGLLHAIDASSPESANGTIDVSGGEEIFAFMPERLLANLPALMNNATSFDHIYGLDGGITRVHTDDNADGVVNGDDTLLLVFGMRRGGDSYYALDVTNPDRPTLEWTIDPSTPGFASLGETWSKMSLVKGRSGTESERFLVFSGGYDANTLDDTATPTPTNRGNALYVIDTDGNLVWTVNNGSEASMQYAFAADPTVIDSNGDGLADRLYAGDLGGQVWRVDFDDMRSARAYSVSRLADLANGSHQPFFYSPSVSLSASAADGFLYVALGSGDRTDPMNANSQNKLWVLKDRNLSMGAPADQEVIRSDDLYDVTENLVGSTDATVAAQAQTELATARGWRLDLAPGEKSLSRLLTFEGNLLATTFEPVEAADAFVCNVDPIGRYYQMDIRTALPTSSFADTDGDVSTAQRYQSIPTTNIPASPVVVFPQGSEETQVYVGLTAVDKVETQLSRVYWHAR